MGERQSVSETADPHWPQLLLCVVLAPVLSAIFSGVAGCFDASWGFVLMLAPVAWLFVLLCGVLPALLFGSVGCILAERFLSKAPLLGWGAVGALAALTYVGASLGAAALGLNGLQWAFPWFDSADFFGVSVWSPPICIVLAGGAAAMLYRWLSRPRTARTSAGG